MEIFRKFLIRLKLEYKKNFNKTLLLLCAAVVVFGGLSFIADAIWPNDMIFRIIRSAILIPLSLSLFSCGYFLSLRLHEMKIEKNPEWMPYRSRFSPSWRRRIAIISGAFLFVIGLGLQPGVGYTFTASVVAAFALGLFAFIRMTKKETQRAALEIPDARDLAFSNLVSKNENEVAAKKAAIKEKRRGFFNGGSGSSRLDSEQ